MWYIATKWNTSERRTKTDWYEGSQNGRQTEGGKSGQSGWKKSGHRNSRVDREMFGDLLGLKDEPIHIIRWTGLMGTGRSVSTGGSTNGMSFLRFLVETDLLGVRSVAPVI